MDIVDNEREHRYEAYLDGRRAGVIRYQDTPDARIFLHTEVEPAYRRAGVGGALVRGALEAVRARGGTVAAVCPFVTAYLARHPEFQDVVAKRRVGPR